MAKLRSTVQSPDDSEPAPTRPRVQKPENLAFNRKSPQLGRAKYFSPKKRSQNGVRAAKLLKLFKVLSKYNGKSIEKWKRSYQNSRYS